LDKHTTPPQTTHYLTHTDYKTSANYLHFSTPKHSLSGHYNKQSLGFFTDNLSKNFKSVTNISNFIDIVCRTLKAPDFQLFKKSAYCSPTTGAGLPAVTGPVTTIRRSEKWPGQLQKTL